MDSHHACTFRGMAWYYDYATQYYYDYYSPIHNSWFN